MKSFVIENAIMCGDGLKNDIKKIAEDKMEDLNTNNLESAQKMVAGTARSMGIKVE